MKKLAALLLSALFLLPLTACRTKETAGYAAEKPATQEQAAALLRRRRHAHALERRGDAPGAFCRPYAAVDERKAL